MIVKAASFCPSIWSGEGAAIVFWVLFMLSVSLVSSPVRTSQRSSSDTNLNFDFGLIYHTTPAEKL